MGGKVEEKYKQGQDSTVQLLQQGSHNYIVVRHETIQSKLLLLQS
jgi:hypothetical protein